MEEKGTRKTRTRTRSKEEADRSDEAYTTVRTSATRSMRDAGRGCDGNEQQGKQLLLQFEENRGYTRGCGDVEKRHRDDAEMRRDEASNSPRSVSSASRSRARDNTDDSMLG